MLRLLGRIFTSVRIRNNANVSAGPQNLTYANYLCTNFALKPQMESNLYRAPPQVRGMTLLDKEAFAQTVTVPALRVPTRFLNKVMKSLKKSTIQRPGVPRVVQDNEESPDFRLELQHYELRLTYNNLKSEEVLEAVLPQGQDVTSAFSRVGHIAHMNLRDHQLPYRNLIGRVIMDKNPGVTCVVNKTNVIDSTYRNFKMEVLAGEENMVAKVKENGMTYEFDFSRVYWNPRLSTEHQRVVELVKSGDTVFDVFAGVGPFAIPAARLGATVFANDLNPESYRWLQHNSRVNKVEGKVKTFNLDGRAFIRGPLKQELLGLLKGKGATHVVMNLPALALEFLDAYRGLLHQEAPCDDNLPTVHCYGFSKDDNPERDMMERASLTLGFPLEDRCSVHFVRNVAPNKDMMCVSFTLPKDVLFGQHEEQTESSEEPTPKRQKCKTAEES
ncbi:tRNA (guanine(37)-N1)-methyltransferase isoform X2 [Syngnathoides biaculeatus]|uniref:tRNA (guanine(37)-N1)-methyltransferase isoform X2 n=1 Tax=Syngnathoides biaculeatus TaxID=300417 RepID=UPI002ADDAA35|nr:tRNA (guanine(37)-N1)-methyltransferase isoform X2 [Syngnathoides biaculeatus]